MSKIPRRDPTDYFVHAGLMMAGAGAYMQFGLAWSLIGYGVALTVSALLGLKMKATRETARLVRQMQASR